MKKILLVVLVGMSAAAGSPKKADAGIPMTDTAPKKTSKWKVMSTDTFAREDYVAGEFDTREQAKAFIDRKEASAAKTQDQSLRDSWWIVPPR